MRPRAALLAAVPVLAGLLACAGCATRRAGNALADGAWGPDVLPPPAPRDMLASLEPVRARIHPLTRLMRRPDGGWGAAVHLELLDAYDQPVRWLGAARFELVPAAGRAEPVTWTLDFSRADRSAEAYDRVTRTYVATLERLPAWLVRPPADTDEPSEPPPVTPGMLRVQVLTWDASLRPRMLDDTARFGFGDPATADPSAPGSAR